MTAAHTTQPEIRAGTQYQPLFLPTGMRLFHNQYVFESNIHIISP